MDLSKVVSRLEEIEDHVERLKRIEQLMDKIVELNERQAHYLEQMWKMYEEAKNAAANASRMQ